MIKVRIFVHYQESVFDPQSKAIEDALNKLGHNNISEVRKCKCFEMVFDEDDEKLVKEQVKKMCDELLVNPNTEKCKYEIYNL